MAVAPHIGVSFGELFSRSRGRPWPRLPSVYITLLMAERGYSAEWIEKRTGIASNLIELHLSHEAEPNPEQQTLYAKAFGMVREVFERGFKSIDLAYEGAMPESDGEGEVEPDSHLAEAIKISAALDDDQLSKAAKDKKTPAKIRAHLYRLLADRIAQQD